MRRKQKRLLQAVGLALAALVFLPNVGLWSLYRERQLEGGAGGAAAEGEAQCHWCLLLDKISTCCSVYTSGGDWSLQKIKD
nr:polypeptide N-acetylgalactosaminyltransferase 10-like isoform X2 [Chelonoidis abingdonii]